MDASVAATDRGGPVLSVDATRLEIKAQVAEDAARRWPLAALYAPMIATYEVRQLAGGGGVDGLIRTAIREVRDFLLGAIYSVKSSPKARHFDVLMLAMEPRQASNHYSLMAWLERNGLSCALLTESHRPAATIEGVLAPVLLAESVAGPRSFLRGIREAVKLFQTCRFTPNQSVERAWVLRRLRRRVSEGGRLFARAAGVLDQISPDVVVSCDDCDPHARAVLLEARRRGIPTIITQFGMAGPYHVEWSHLAADMVAVLGIQQADALEDHGIPRSRLVITGSPRFDAAAALRTPSLPHAVLFASQPDAAGCFGGEDRRIKLLNEIYSGFRRAGVEVVVRPHPDESIELHRRLIENAGLRARISVPARQTALNALAECGVLVTFHSTLAIEAALAGRSVVFYRPIGAAASSAAEAFVVAAINAGWARSAEGPEQLALILRSADVWSGNQSGIDKFSMNSDGNATERVGRLILSRLGR